MFGQASMLEQATMLVLATMLEPDKREPPEWPVAVVEEPDKRKPALERVMNPGLT